MLTIIRRIVMGVGGLAIVIGAMGPSTQGLMIAGSILVGASLVAWAIEEKTIV